MDQREEDQNAREDVSPGFFKIHSVHLLAVVGRAKRDECLGAGSVVLLTARRS
jgi:hypothetical protein